MNALALLRPRRAKIVATLGPASSDPAMLDRLLRAGVDVFRLNFSHGNHADHASRLATLRELEARYDHPIGVLADIQGPKLRIGSFAGDAVVLEAGTMFRLDLDDAPGDASRVQLPHPEILQAARPGMRLLLDDGKIRLEVTEVASGWLDAVVRVGGRLSDRKGVNVPDVRLPIPALTNKDRADLAFALDMGVDLIGLSFVQSVADVIEARDLVGDRAWIVAKIEKPQALEDLDGIIAAADAVMVARGDLGVELPPEDVPLIQKRIVSSANQARRPVIVATQMLESMIKAPTPTRAEAADVATAVLDGADAVMLSAETATGRYPEEAVAIMSRIIARVEQEPHWLVVNRSQRDARVMSRADAIPASARQIAETIGAASIVAHTHGGATALHIARQRPAVPILALTPFMSVARRLTLAWGVAAQVTAQAAQTMTQAVAAATAGTRAAGLVGRGDADVVVTAGMPFGQSGTTNALRIAPLEQRDGASPGSE